MFFIRDCNNKIVGNKLGYKTHKGAEKQVNTKGGGIYRRIHEAFYSVENQSSENRLFYSIRFEK